MVTVVVHDHAERPPRESIGVSVVFSRGLHDEDFHVKAHKADVVDCRRSVWAERCRGALAGDVGPFLEGKGLFLLLVDVLWQCIERNVRAKVSKSAQLNDVLKGPVVVLVKVVRRKRFVLYGMHKRVVYTAVEKGIKNLTQSTALGVLPQKMFNVLWYQTVQAEVIFGVEEFAYVDFELVVVPKHWRRSKQFYVALCRGSEYLLNAGEPVRAVKKPELALGHNVQLSSGLVHELGHLVVKF